jgi:hypothetical protein
MAALNEFPSNEQPVEESQPIPEQPADVPAIVANSQSHDASEVDPPPAVETVDPVEMQIDKVIAEWPNTNWWA